MAKRKVSDVDEPQANGAGQENGSPFRLHGDLLTTTLLAFLRNWNAYGYQLSQQLQEAGLPAFDSGTVYRTLRQLERAGMVSSFWDTSESGPARRMYSLTKAGDIFLSGWIDVLGRYQAVLRKTMDGLAPKATDAEDSEEPRAARG
ncbi:MAG TPA: helix-turn-helix transcriptional regulator [Dehalococcoidia bacterium]|jgi:poly-beta-hydroxybutyrate-responsive repressor|nr:helix-turn-helix transcriptional regulator [Dehalococcoidia bacterium]